jgi:ribosomal protein S12 methylthiotransferase
LKKINVVIVSLGCDKNRLDSEQMLSNISAQYLIVNNPEAADIIIVNTCGFIEAAKEESINTILEMAAYKKNFHCSILVVTGCLGQRYKNELMELIPEIDILLGVNDYKQLNNLINNFLENGQKSINCNDSFNEIDEGDRILTTASYYAYLRIAEGCDNYCTYCIIPKIRGSYRSRKMENIISEAEKLIKNGVKELILVAQDTTLYGIDIYGQKSLSVLINKLSTLKDLKWIRILYCYPEEITDELIDAIASNKTVCKYLDIPIQHINDEVLKRMGRRGRRKDIISTIEKLRLKVPEIVLRTSLIVGFPGETKEEFDELKDFVKMIRLDKVGVFKYSEEEGTPAALMELQITEDIKVSRERELMLIQMQISKEINKNKIGKIYDVLVEGKKADMWFGRNSEMSPQIDGLIYFNCDKIINVGDITHVKITDGLEYDLKGVVVDESCQ